MSSGRPRIALLGLYHEANTFSPLTADMALFERSELLRGEQIRERYHGTPATIGGMLAVADAVDVDLELILFGRLTPTGPITGDTFDRLLDEMIDGLAKGGPWDGVALPLHGAAVAEHIPDADAEIAARVRETVGPGTPVATALDMHGNLTDRLASNVDVVIGYRTNPHLDAADRARECMHALVRTIRGEISPGMAFLPLPLIASIARQDTDEPPMEDVMARVWQWDSEPGMIGASVFEGYPYADVPGMGMSVIACDEDGGGTAARAVADLAELIWECRADLQGGGVSIEDALDVAARAPAGPVVLLDVGDNIGGGGPGDSMVLWQAAREHGVRGVLQTTVDGAAAASCIAAGEGGRVSLSVGARNSHSPGEPAPIAGKVVATSDGRYKEPGTVHGGFQDFDMGQTAVVETEEGTILISEHAAPNVSIHQFASLGIDPRDYRVVVAKGVNAPRGAYRPIATELLVVDTPGVTSLRYDEFEYRHRRRPLYPFEQEVPLPGAPATG